MKTYTPKREYLGIAEMHGLQNVRLIAKWAGFYGVFFWVACALFQKESGGRNVWGSSDGSAATFNGCPLPPAEDSFWVFWWYVNTLRRQSNGVGPGQITNRSLLNEMIELGLKPWDASDNIQFAMYKLSQYMERNKNHPRGPVWAAGRLYNGSEAYADNLLEVGAVWRDRFW